VIGNYTQSPPFLQFPQWYKLKWDTKSKRPNESYQQTFNLSMCYFLERVLICCSFINRLALAFLDLVNVLCSSLYVFQWLSQVTSFGSITGLGRSRCIIVRSSSHPMTHHHRRSKFRAKVESRWTCYFESKIWRSKNVIHTFVRRDDPPW
jgi:hypothetical protein